MLTTGQPGNPRGSVNRQESFPFLLIVVASQVGTACPLGGRCLNTVRDIVGPMPDLGAWPTHTHHPSHPPTPTAIHRACVWEVQFWLDLFHTSAHQCMMTCPFAPRTLPWVLDLNYSSHLALFWGVHLPTGNSHTLAVPVGGSAG